MKKMILCAVALFVAVATPAFAETQSIRVGGDITSSYIKNANMNLNDSNGTLDDSSFLTQARVYFHADLTDNVTAYVRVLSQREWDSQDNIGSSASNNEDGVKIDLAYVQLSEFLYSPLTVTIGRQEIEWGSGLVIADGNPNINPNSALDNGWYGLEAGFDAIRVQLDFDPVTVDAFAAKIDEDFSDGALTSSPRNEEDTILFGINFGYIFPSEVLMEWYWLLEAKKNSVAKGDVQDQSIHTIGVRAEGAAVAIDENLYLEGELAYQWGELLERTTTGRDIDRKAWAAILGASYMFQNEYNPKVSLYYDYRSGDKLSDGSSGSEKKDKAWAAPFYVRGIGNLIDQLSNGIGAEEVISGSSNIHAVTLSGSFVPFEDIEVGLSLIYAKFDEEVNDGRGTDLGIEYIGSVSYDYTEDVTFSLKGSLFDPDSGFKATQDDSAYEILSSVSVEF